MDLLDQTTTCRAMLVRDYAVGELSRRWAGLSGVRQDHHAGQHLFIIENVFAVRIKKLDDSSRSQNARTPHDDQ
ncbi:MAG: hypothetical protein KJZ78_18350, partial [Bryobacteraceae bacterium]|nr:hypothetical protein [Bryobacteraceae bacterium]